MKREDFIILSLSAGFGELCHCHKYLGHKQYAFASHEEAEKAIEKYLKGGNMFTKKDLRTGMIVEAKNGNMYLVMENMKTKCHKDQEFVCVKHGGYIAGDQYRDDLTCKCSSRSDIMKVYVAACDGDLLSINGADKALIWQREEVKEVTMKDLEEKYGCKVKIVKEQQ